MQFLGAVGAARNNKNAAQAPSGRILCIHPQTVDYTEHVSTLVQVEWSAPIRYLDTKPAGWRIHFLTLNENFGTFDAKGLPPGNYTIDNVPFFVERPRAAVAPVPPGQAMMDMQQTKLGGDAYGKKVKPARTKKIVDLQQGTTNEDVARMLAEAKAKLLIVAPCYSSLISMVTVQNFQFPNVSQGEDASLGSVGETAISLLSIADPQKEALGQQKVKFTSKNSLALAWAAVQQFYLLAGKKTSTQEDVEAFIQTQTSTVDLNSASVTVYDMMKPLSRCVSFQSKRCRQVYGDFATSRFSVDTATLTCIFNFLVSSRCLSKTWLNRTFHLRCGKDAKSFKVTPVLVSTSKLLHYFCSAFPPSSPYNTHTPKPTPPPLTLFQHLSAPTFFSFLYIVQVRGKQTT